MKTMNQNGFTLMGVLAAVAASLVVVLAIGQLMVQSKTVEVRASVQADIDRAHILNVQRAKSVSFISQNLLDPATTGLSVQDTEDLRSCFSGRQPASGSCQRFNNMTCEVGGSGCTFAQ